MDLATQRSRETSPVHELLLIVIIYLVDVPSFSPTFSRLATDMACNYNLSFDNREQLGFLYDWRYSRVFPRMTVVLGDKIASVRSLSWSSVQQQQQTEVN